MNCDYVFEILTRGPFPSRKQGEADVERSVEMHLVGCHECRQLAEALRPAVQLFHESMADTDAGGLPQYEGRLAPAELGVLPALVRKAMQEGASPASSDTASPNTAGQLSQSQLSQSQFSQGPFSQGQARRASVASGPRVPLGRTSSPIHSRASQLFTGEFFAGRFFTGRCAAWLIGSAIVVLAVLNAGVEDRWGFSPKRDRPAAPSSVAAMETSPLFWTKLGLSAACLNEIPPEGDKPASLATPSAASLLCCTRCHTASRPGLIAMEKLALVQQSCGACHEWE